jgi:hypothetical protein
MKSEVRWWTNSIIREFRDSERLYGLRQRKAKSDGVGCWAGPLLEKREKGRTPVISVHVQGQARGILRVKVAHPPEPTKEPRFTMVSAPVTVLDPNGTSHQENHVLLLDSSTGRVWLYSPMTSITTTPDTKGEGEAVTLPSLFVRVWVEGVDNQSDKPKTRKYHTVPN